jgi:hypothetical protein
VVGAIFSKVSANRPSRPDPVLGGATGSPDALVTYRDRLTKGEDAIDPDRWARSLPAAYGVPPRIRIGSSRWFNLLWLLPIGFVLLIVAVAAGQGLRHVPAVARFIDRYPGTSVSAGTGPAGVGGRDPFPQPAADAVHHPLGDPDPRRPPTAVLDQA